MNATVPVALVLLATAVMAVPGPGPMRVRRPRGQPDPRLRRAIVAGPGLAAAAVLVLPGIPELALVTGLCGAAIGWWLPDPPSAAVIRARRWWLAVGLELWAATLSSGLPVAVGLESVLGALPPAAAQPSLDRLARVAALLRVGADPDRAWSAADGDPELTSIALAARRSAAAGADLAEVIRQQARSVRRADRAQRQRRSARGAVLIAAPLGLCFLPAFICLGLAPVVVALLDTLSIWR